MKCPVELDSDVHPQVPGAADDRSVIDVEGYVTGPESPEVNDESLSR